jgi:hypothetical protein
MYLVKFNGSYLRNYRVRHLMSQDRNDHIHVEYYIQFFGAPTDNDSKNRAPNVIAHILRGNHINVKTKSDYSELDLLQLGTG